jgi:hypothetical protein
MEEEGRNSIGLGVRGPVWMGEHDTASLRMEGRAFLAVPKPTAQWGVSFPPPRLGKEGLQAVECGLEEQLESP